MAANRRVPAPSAALRALTAAALALPGVRAVAADQPEFSLEIGHYAEGKRDLAGQSYKDLRLKPVTDDSAALHVTAPFASGWTARVNYSQDSWSGATPVVSLPVAAVDAQLVAGASSPNSYYIDTEGRPVVVDWDSYDPDTNTYEFSQAPGLVHIMASASPETRRQWDGSIIRAFDGGEFTAGGGISSEHDYLSRFVNVGGKFYVDDKLTTLDWGASATYDNIRASLAANSAADTGYYTARIHDYQGQPTIFGRRHDLAASAGVTRILNQRALVQGELSFTRSAGFLENPYKAVILAFDDPDQIADPSGFKYVPIRGTLEQRPDVRNQVALNLRYTQEVGADGAFHANYRFFHDNWGIDSHSLDLSLDQPLGGGWMVTPSARYYSQSRAFFYAPFFLFHQPFPAHPGGPLDHDQILQKYFSSDQRLSAFGAVEAGLALQKTLGHGIKLDVSAQHYWHRGNLKLGGGGEGRFADFDYSLVMAGLDLDLAARADDLASWVDDGGGKDRTAAADRTSLFAPLASPIPVTPGSAGGVSLSATYDGWSRKGRYFHGRERLTVADASAVCGTDPCPLMPLDSGGHEFRFDVAFALNPHLALAVEPRLVDRSVNLIDTYKLPAMPVLGGPDGSGRHSSRGWGDTRLLAIGTIGSGSWQARGQFGLSLPTGRSGSKLNGKNDYVPYAQQTGSGTLDFTPAATVAYDGGRFLAGAGIDGIARLSSHNSNGYRLGNRLAADGWFGARIAPWLIADAALEFVDQGSIHGAYKDHFEHDAPFEETVQADYDVNGDGVVDANDTYVTTVYRDAFVAHHILSPLDLPDSYGGTLLSGSLGLTLAPQAGPLRGDLFTIEWREPLSERLDGVQQRQHSMLVGRLSIAI